MIPTIIEERPLNITALDVYSRLMMDRIIFLGEEINADVANTVVAQLLYLDHQSTDEITIYINSPGGDIDSGLAIYDTIQLIKSPVKTVVVGEASSMASIILVAGKVRCALPHSRILIHQPRGGFGGLANDIIANADEFKKFYKNLADIYVKHTGQPFDKIYNDMSCDKWFSPEEAVEYGLIDKIIVNK